MEGMRSAQANLFLFEHQERPSDSANVHGVLQFTLTITQLPLTSKTEVKKRVVHDVCHTHSPNVVPCHISQPSKKLKAFQLTNMQFP